MKNENKMIYYSRKEIPIKPEYKQFTFESGYFCGVCDHLVGRDFIYCPTCGQKIKWEENKNVNL